MALEKNDKKNIIKIPHIFYSDANDKPFSNCIDCNKYLLTEGQQYIVEKVIKKYKDYDSSDTLFEYAICIACYLKLANSFSKLSIQRTEEYFEKNVDLESRRKNILQKKDDDINEWISNCLIKGTQVEDISEYHIACHCDGNNMILTHLPYLISGEAIEEIQELLSTETRDEIDGFIKDNFDYPPEIKDILKDQPVFIL